MGAQRTPSSSWRGTRPRARTLSTPCSSTKGGQRRKGALISHASSTNAMYSVRCRRDFLSLAVYLRRYPRPGRASPPTVFSAYTPRVKSVSVHVVCGEGIFSTHGTRDHGRTLIRTHGRMVGATRTNVRHEAYSVPRAGQSERPDATTPTTRFLPNGPHGMSHHASRRATFDLPASAAAAARSEPAVARGPRLLLWHR